MPVLYLGLPNKIVSCSQKIISSPYIRTKLYAFGNFIILSSQLIILFHNLIRQPDWPIHINFNMVDRQQFKLTEQDIILCGQDIIFCGQDIIL